MSSQGERIRLSVKCGDDLRFYDLLCHSVTTALDLDRAIGMSVEAFAQSFNRELTYKSHKQVGQALSNLKCKVAVSINEREE